MSKGNHRLPAWLAGITALVATAGVALAQEPNATGDAESAAIAGLKDCTSSNGGTSGRCDETQSGQTTREQREDTARSARDEDARTQMAQRDDRDDAPAPRDETTKGFDEASSVAQDGTSNDPSQAGSEHLAGHSADETQQTRVVPPAHATPSHPSMSGATASSGTTGQDNDESTSAGANTSDADAATRQNEDHSSQNVARVREAASSSDRDHDNDNNGNADGQDASDRSDAMASGQDTPSTRSVPPEHATRMPENDRARSASETAANERAGETSSSASDEYRNDANAPSRTDTYASQHGERDDGSNDREIDAGTSTGIASASAVQGQFDALDSDHDGTIDAAEAAVSTTLRAQFFALDADGDGKISMSEFKGASDIASIRADRGKRRE